MEEETAFAAVILQIIAKNYTRLVEYFILLFEMNINTSSVKIKILLFFLNYDK